MTTQTTPVFLSERSDTDPYRFNYAAVTSQEIQETTEAFLADVDSRIDTLIAQEGERTVSNTLLPFEEIKVRIENYETQLSFFVDLHEQDAVRDASRNALQAIDGFITTRVSLNVDLYEALAAVEVSSSDVQTVRVHDNLMRDFRRSGVDKDEKTRERIAQIQDRVTQLQLAYEKNSADISEMWLEESDLIGVPESTLASFARNDEGRVRVTTAYPEILPVMKYADNASTREQASRLFHTQSPENEPILKEILELRNEFSTLLGYTTYADFDVEKVMTGDTQTVKAFLEVLDRATARRYSAEFDALTEELVSDTGRTKLMPYDSGYYAEKLKASRYNLDPKAVMEYFPFKTVLDGIHSVYEKLFGIRFEKVDASTLNLWASDGIYVYDIYEADKILGRVYLDMHPREGKFGHGACGAIVPGVKDRQLPEVVLMCNFPKPTDDDPALMLFGQVNTWFHEFGHGLHQLFGSGLNWIDFSGTNTQRDFVEAPSQMLENWLGDPAVLQMIGVHYKSGEPISADMVEAIRRSEEFGSGMHVRRQLSLSRFSFEIYSRDPATLDFTALWSEIDTEYGLVPDLPGMHMHTRFGHIVAGYDSKYYTYMWSLAISKHLLTAFDQSNLMDPVPAKRYRDLVLAPGGSKDAADLIEDFTGSFSVQEIGDALKQWLTQNPDEW